jgi:hypothetical protein
MPSWIWRRLHGRIPLPVQLSQMDSGQCQALMDEFFGP